jgi:hypothetical protein
MMDWRDSYLEDNGMPSGDFIAIEEGHQQALWVGVRPTWIGDEKTDYPIIQISYQEEYKNSSLMGPVFLSAETWRELNQSVERRLKHRRKRFSAWWRRFGEFWGKV